MSFQFEDWGEDPANWVTRHGAPAACLGDPIRWPGTGGMPSFEADDGLVVFDLLLVETVGADMRVKSAWYRSLVAITTDGLVPTHHGEQAQWRWRPAVYRRSYKGGWMRMGSQWELRHRMTLRRIQDVTAEVELPFDPPSDATPAEFLAALDTALGMVEQIAAWAHGVASSTRELEEAEERAEQLLGETLSPLQWLEWKAKNDFHVRGGATGNTYRVRMGDGFSIVDPVTHEEMGSYCLHTEYWLPDADMALAIKLGLEEETMEPGLLEAARGRITGKGSTAEDRTKELRYAADIEKELNQRGAA